MRASHLALSSGGGGCPDRGHQSTSGRANIDMKFDRVRAALMQVCDPGRHCFVVFMVHGSSFTMFESGAICYDKNEKLAKDKHVLFALQKVHPTE